VLSYRWHPYAVDPAVDYTKEQPTLVTFILKDAPGNATLLTSGGIRLRQGAASASSGSVPYEHPWLAGADG